MSEVRDAPLLASFASRLETMYGIDRQDREALVRLPCSAQSVGAGSYLVRIDEWHSQGLILLTGYVQRRKLVKGGGRQIVAIYLAGD